MSEQITEIISQKSFNDLTKLRLQLNRLKKEYCKVIGGIIPTIPTKNKKNFDLPNK